MFQSNAKCEGVLSLFYVEVKDALSAFEMWKILAILCLFLLKFYCCFLSSGMSTQLCPFVSFSNYFFLSCFLVILSLPKCNNKPSQKLQVITVYFISP